MELRLGGAGARAHHAGDLSVGVALDRVEHEDRAGAVGEGRDRTIEVEAGVDLSLGGLDLAGRSRALFAKGPTLIGTSLTQHDVDRESVQPGRERGVPAKPVQSLPRANKDLLGSGLGVVVVAA